MRLSITVALHSLAFSFIASATPDPSTPDAPQCCDKLAAAIPHGTFTNTGRQSVQYGAILQSYFNVPDALAPNCFVQPTSTKQIAKIVTILSQNQCKFAVKGGGHMLYVGANGIKDGVTVDLRQMRNTTLSMDKKTVSVQPGAKWGEVYQTLDALGYAIPGGRGADVGVAGLTLVLGNGTVTNANARQNADLFKGLKGGTGNLGLVTRFDYIAFESGPLWGGVAYYNFTDIHKFYQPLVDFTNNIDSDPYGSLIITWTNNATTKTTTVGNIYDYTGNATEKPSYAHTDPSTTTHALPSAFAPFAFSKVGLPITNTLRVDSLYNLTFELNSPNAVRNIYSAIIFKADTAIVQRVDSIIQDSLHAYISGAQKAPYIAAQIQYQPYPRIFSNHSQQRGGNVMGLDRVTDNSILLNFMFIWDDPAQDTFIQEELLAKTLERISTYTKSVPGGFRDWQYVNYAFADQDPLGSYGNDNVEFLKTVSKRYDPNQVFQQLVPGGWKLGDAGKRKKDYNFNNFVRE